MAFVAVRTRYYKTTAALAILDHCSASRSGFTRSVNVKPSHSKNNVSYYYNDAESPTAGFRALERKYKAVTGRKTRSDFNALFKHVLILSEPAYSNIERRYGEEETKRRVMQRFKKYAASIKSEFDFEPISIDCHFDEGIEELCNESGERKFIRNIHCHINFFNFDFDKKYAPLKFLYKKGLDKNGRTNSLNPNFVRMQDLAGEAFENSPFRRGVSKSITGKQHLSKELFVKKQVETLTQEVKYLNRMIAKLDDLIIKRSERAIRNLQKLFKRRTKRRVDIRSNLRR